MERNWFTLRKCQLPVLPAGSEEIKILHIADLHMCAEQKLKTRWVRNLAKLAPDFVVNTGDNLGQKEGLPTLLEALQPLLKFPGVFVPGSNDYYAGKPKNPFTYLYKTSAKSLQRNRENSLPTKEMFTVFTESGWKNLTNTHTVLQLKDVDFCFLGVDDPHLGKETYPDPKFWGKKVESNPNMFVVGVTHAPYVRVLNKFVSNFQANLIFAGHTHGGQVCVPGVGALTSNCDLPVKQAKGLSTWTLPEIKGSPEAWLHVSAGLGTSRFAPLRFACKPEATLLTLCAKS